MLATSPRAKTIDGVRRENPSDFARATAQTASSTPDRTNTNHAMTNSWKAVLSRSGYGSLVRRALVAQDSRLHAHGRRSDLLELRPVHGGEPALVLRDLTRPVRGDPGAVAIPAVATRPDPRAQPRLHLLVVRRPDLGAYAERGAASVGDPARDLGDPAGLGLQHLDDGASAQVGVGAVDAEQVREPRHAQPEVGARAVGPHVAQRDPVDTAHVDGGEIVGRGEAGAPDQHVDLVQPAVRGADAGRLDGGHPVGDDLDVV